MALENQILATKKYQLQNDQQLGSLKLMQREFRTVEALLNDKDNKIVTLEEAIQDKVNKQAKIVKDAQTQT